MAWISETQIHGNFVMKVQPILSHISPLNRLRRIPLGFLLPYSGFPWLLIDHLLF
jgi:hypothetical protein